MKLEIHRDQIHLRMESELERAFVEDTLGLRADGDSISLVRVERRTETRIVDSWLQTGPARQPRRAGRA